VVIVAGEVGGTVGGTVVEVGGDVGAGAVATGVDVAEASVVVGGGGRRPSVPHATSVTAHTIDTIGRNPDGDERIIAALQRGTAHPARATSMTTREGLESSKTRKPTRPATPRPKDT
jgi:hypothetical protein